MSEHSSFRPTLDAAPISHRRASAGAPANDALQEKSQPAWVSLESAARFLGTKPTALRKLIERKMAELAPMKGRSVITEVCFDGIRVRKLGRRWKVLVSAEWSASERG